MKVLFQIALCICLIILAGGTLNYIHEDPTFGGGILLIMVWCIYAGLILATNAFEKSQTSAAPKQEWTERITHLEKRLTDIQDVVIAIDDKLSRQERQSGVLADAKNKS